MSVQSIKVEPRKGKRGQEFFEGVVEFDSETVCMSFNASLDALKWCMEMAERGPRYRGLREQGQAVRDLYLR